MSTTADPTSDAPEKLDFIRQAVADHVAAGGSVVTRFPPEPNGFLHIGHAKALALSFGIAEEFGGRCHLRFDDTNPSKEEERFMVAMREDIQWLGFDWGEHEYCASSYFDQLYDWACTLIRAGKAYVCELTAEQTREYRGTLTEPGTPSPFRDRSVDENLDLFARMRAGEFADGAKTLRAKIDMASPNVNLRDPVLYRVMHHHHQKTGDAWCIYPMYDWAHGQSDSIEGISHSLCSLEFEDHRPLYDWFIEQLGIHHPRQMEFARLSLDFTVMSKRKLHQLVNEGHVDGWDDPRMPTLRGFRRKGCPPEAIRQFCRTLGVTKYNSRTDPALLDHAMRDVLNRTASRVMGVLDPVKLVVTNYPEDQVESLDAINNPEDESAGTRSVPFSRELWIERDDFMEDAPRKFFRLSVGREVRLRYAYFVTCTGVVKNDAGEITEIHCTYDPETRGGDPPDGRKVKGTIHWVCATSAADAEVRLYEPLFVQANPDQVAEGETFLDHLNPDARTIVRGVKVEPAAAATPAGTTVQFERKGYFCPDAASTPDAPIFHRTVALRDSWGAKVKAGSTG